MMEERIEINRTLENLSFHCRVKANKTCSCFLLTVFTSLDDCQRRSSQSGDSKTRSRWCLELSACLSFSVCVCCFWVLLLLHTLVESIKMRVLAKGVLPTLSKRERARNFDLFSLSIASSWRLRNRRAARDHAMVSSRNSQRIRRPAKMILGLFR